MAPFRAYVPSRALLRALWRPSLPKCPSARPLPVQFVCRKGHRAFRLEDDQLKPNIPGLPGLRFPKTVEEAEKIMAPLPDDQLDDPNLPEIDWWEQDLDSTRPARLVQRIATPEDRRKHNELHRMLEEDSTNPNYDDAVLNRRLLDDLMTNPNFADLVDELKDLKEDIMTREEVAALRKEQEPELKELEASLKMATHQTLQDLINDPDLADARADIEDLRDKISATDDMEDPEVQEAIERVEERLATNEAFQRKLAAQQAESGEKDEENEETERELQELEDWDEDTPVNTPEDFDKLLVQMKEVMGLMGGDKEIEEELDAVIKEDPFAHSDGDIEKELDFDQLAQELTKLAQSSASTSSSETFDDDEEVRGDPELEAKVDKIMQDPKLMEKLLYIQQLIVEEQRKAADITQIQHETAPDPLTLDSSHVTSIKQQMEIARQDLEHIAALRRLRVNLLPPFNVAPALKSFNQAIELAYLGANDDIRRILWRSYNKARVLPTFVQNLSDDAWDLLYYSQAVTWRSNQNRQNHLKMLLQDLKSVGRDGPPTHPSTLAGNKQGHLEM